jgi:S-adenosylmethionine/arginine decarboxylase-like enzyme
MAFEPIHQHMLIRGTVPTCHRDPAIAKAFLRAVVERIGMVPVTEPQAAYVEEPGNIGITGSINLATSHIAYHVWDETSMIMMDVYSCKTFDPLDVIDVMREFFGLPQVEYDVIDRLTMACRYSS